MVFTTSRILFVAHPLYYYGVPTRDVSFIGAVYYVNGKKTITKEELNYSAAIGIMRPVTDVVRG